MRSKIAVSTTLGAIFTWYDFIIFNIAVVMIFPQLFFPGMSGLLPVLAFAVGFLFRPLGSMIFGSLGDRFGRKLTLVMTLFVTGISTVIIGVLPTHEQIGIWATVILVLARLTQTAAVGGEWAAASVMMTEHHADNKRQGFIASFVNSAFAMANILAAAMFMLIMSFGSEFFAQGGWRIPFLLSGVLLIVGVYIRSRAMETPEFTLTQAQRRIVSHPVRSVISQHYRVILAAGMAISLAPAWTYSIMVFGAGVMLQNGVIDRPELAQTQFIAWWFIAAAMIFVGWCSDRINHYSLLLIGIASSLILAWPFMHMIAQGHALPLFLLLAAIIAPGMAVAPVLFSSLFPAEVRQTGSGISYNLGLMLSGMVTVISQKIYSSTQDFNSVALVFVALTLMSLVSVLYLRGRSQ